MRFKKTQRQRQQPALKTKMLATIDRQQRRLSNYLNQKTARWNRNHKLSFLICICLLFGGASLALLIGGFQGNYTTDSARRFSTIGQPIKPAPIMIPHSPLTMTGDTIIFQRFHHLVDSLRQTPEGKALVDAYIGQHPGLLDSVAYIERMMK